MRLVIDWRVSDVEWIEARNVSIREVPGGDYDRAKRVFYWLLMADIQVRQGQTLLFPPERLHDLLMRQSKGLQAMGSESFEVDDSQNIVGVNINIFDFARIVHLAILDLLSENSNKNVERSYKEADGSIRYIFSSADQKLSLSTTLFPDIILHTTWDSVINAYDAFITTLRASIEDRASGLLAWESIKFINDDIHPSRR
jgi:hypothetical protein